METTFDTEKISNRRKELLLHLLGMLNNINVRWEERNPPEAKFLKIYFTNKPSSISVFFGSVKEKKFEMIITNNTNSQIDFSKFHIGEDLGTIAKYIVEVWSKMK